ncbi:MAG: glycosyltransferase family 2 protein [Lachnospiraceae bacterium]
MENIIVTIIIATYNSEKKLPEVLKALRKQTISSETMEIIVVDGGSSDSTVEIAKKFRCSIINNPKTEPVYAKLLGLQNAKGKYAVVVDHDEVFENNDSLKNRIDALQENPECKVAFCSGYKCPPNYTSLNQYVSEFGDPFSLYIYNFSKYDTYLEKVLKKNYTIVAETENYFCLSFEKMKKYPLFELCCVGTIIDLEYFKEKTNIIINSTEMVHLFYIMIEKGVNHVIFSKNDPLLHYSVDSLKSYFPKLKWRICNNIHYAEKGEKGFSGRLNYQKKMKYKKFLFIPYTLILPICIMHSFYLAFTRKNLIYLIHPILCLYVVYQIFIQFFLKILNITPEFRSYDGKKIIKR